jgi:hypothetical protein
VQKKRLKKGGVSARLLLLSGIPNKIQDLSVDKHLSSEQM